MEVILNTVSDVSNDSCSEINQATVNTYVKTVGKEQRGLHDD